jgi:hypothetical protein
VLRCRASRQTYDTSETCKNFGPIRLEFGKVQSKVSLKYDSWHKDVLGKFGNLLGGEMQEFYGTVGKVCIISASHAYVKMAVNELHFFRCYWYR